MLPDSRSPVLGKIAAPLADALARRAASGSTRTIASTAIAAGAGWNVADVLCTAGPRDRPFEERHEGVSIGVVVAGTFQCRSARGEAMLTPGALFLGNSGECYECGHQHAAGDRCIAFHLDPSLLEGVADAFRVRSAAAPFRAPCVPPLRSLAAVVARAAAGAMRLAAPSWEELALEVAVAAVRADLGDAPGRAVVATNRAVLGRVTESVRRIEAEPAADATLARLAADARQSPYHYLRVFRQLTGVTPHQFVLRARLRAAAARLLAGDEKVIDVSLACGFDDLSNFNRAFREEYGMSPRAYRRSGGKR